QSRPIASRSPRLAASQTLAPSSIRSPPCSRKGGRIAIGRRSVRKRVRDDARASREIRGGSSNGGPTRRERLDPDGPSGARRGCGPLPLATPAPPRHQVREGGALHPQEVGGQRADQEDHRREEVGAV